MRCTPARSAPSPASPAPNQGRAWGRSGTPGTPLLEPVLTYQVILPEGADVHTALANLRKIEEEVPELHVVWDETLGQIHVRLMGEIQLEVLQSMLSRRFGLDVTFGEGGILYKETITEPVEGVGHYEPLRHYAEVHLKMEPLPPGSGIQYDIDCREEVLARNWQRLVIANLEEKEHRGVLTGAPPHRRENHPDCWPGPPEAHRRGRFPPGGLAGGAPGPDDDQKRPAGALVPLPAGIARPEPGPGHERHPADGGHLRPRRPGGGDRHPGRFGTGQRPAGAIPGSWPAIPTAGAGSP